jgi:hypothetical protein
MFVIFVITLQENEQDRLKNSVAGIGICDHVIISVISVTCSHWPVVIHYKAASRNMN